MDVVLNYLTSCSSDLCHYILLGLVILASIGAAAHAAAWLPAAKDGTVYAYVRKVLDFLAGNYASAKNALDTQK